MNKENNKYLYLKNEYNLGIGILRVFLSFMVVMDHFYHNKNRYTRFLYYHIPTFFIISFFFTYKTLTSFNTTRIKLRIERLLIPYFSWCTISWIIRNIYFYILKKDFQHSFLDFLVNLSNGHKFIVAYWFQNILILVTFSFLIFIYSFKTKFIFIFSLLYIIFYFLQYSGINYNFCYNNLSVHYRLTFGRFAEVFPNAITGFFLASIDIINKLKKSYIISIFYSSIILISITLYDIFFEFKTFKYGGFRLNIASICIFVIFSLLPFQMIKVNFINNLIKQFTNYTAGIYFSHYLIGKGYIIRSFLLVEYGSFLWCIIIYLISFIISVIGANVFKHTKFKHLFI